MNSYDLNQHQRPVLLGAVHSEAVKLWTLLSNRILLAVSAIIIAGSGVLLSAGLIGRLTYPRFAGTTIEATPMMLVDGTLWAQIPVAILGILAVSGEYTSGQVRLSLLSLPKRTSWLVAKMLVLAGAAFLVGLVGSAISLGASLLVLGDSEVRYSIGFGEAVVLSLHSGLYLAAIAALAIGLAIMLRHVVASLATVLVLLVVAPPMISSIPGIGWVADYMPTIAGRRLISQFDSIAQLTPWGGYGVLLIWLTLAAVLAGALLKVRDV